MYISRVGLPILISSCTFTDSTTSMLKPYFSHCAFTSAISCSSQISPGILWCRAQTMLVTPGICLMSERLILSLPSPYQRKPICIGIRIPPNCKILLSNAAENILTNYNTKMSILTMRYSKKNYTKNIVFNLFQSFSTLFSCLLESAENTRKAILNRNKIN